MKFDLLLTGVGGEGVLTAGALIARAANIEGYHVRGVQLHGLAQRGGTIPTFVRFGSEKEIHSPGIMQANADLVLAFEPLEAVRAAFYARKEKTSFLINTHPYIPVYAHLFKIPYPGKDELVRRIRPFARNIHIYDTHQMAEEEFGSTIFGNTMLIGTAIGLGLIPLKEKSLLESIRKTSPREIENNMKAFELGLKLGRK